MIPPDSVNYNGAEGFERYGEENKRNLIELCGLKPEDKVLDVGCGPGRMAIPLTSYITKGEYHGFDIVPCGITWCQENITPQFKNFHFTHSNILNKTYNPNGTIQARDYRFPFADGSFDIVFLVSVFTHMLPPDVSHYMGEIARVMKKGARCMISFFLLNDESRVHMSSAQYNFHIDMGGYKTISYENPECALAYEEAAVMALYKAAGLAIVPPIYHGSWSRTGPPLSQEGCRRGKSLTYQDVIVARKD
jgi:ubiquinone/menaquinone biosynthesis C-methylase UbiE